MFIGFSAGYHETRSNKLYIANGPVAANTLIFGDFNSGDMIIGKSSGLVTIGNDFYVKGNLYVTGGASFGTTGDYGTQPTFSNSTRNEYGTNLSELDEITPADNDDNQRAPARVKSSAKNETSTLEKPIENNSRAVSKVTNASTKTNENINSSSTIETLAEHSRLMTSLTSNFDSYRNSVDQEFIAIRNEYSSGIATAIAIGQIKPSADGLSVGVGYASFRNESETAVGFGYGRRMDNGTHIQLSLGKNSIATGAGITFSF